MSDRAPTVQQLLKALKQLADWFVFGVNLGVPVPQLKMIELSYSPERRKIEMLQYWLDNNVHPLWSNVVEALEEMDKRALAAQIKDDYLYSAAVSEEATTGMIVAAQRSDADVEEREERISHLEKELEELRREGVESGEREDLLTREIEDLKSKLDKLSSHLIDKVDKIEAQLENREDTIANLESSQTELVLEKGDVMADACVLPERVAAIDFGTGFCSLAFTLAECDSIRNISLGWLLDSVREPTAILLKKNPDGTLTVAKFGSLAQKEISRLNSAELKEYLYFECFKMDLFHKADVSRDMQIKSLDGTSYYLVEIIAFVLCHLKHVLEEHHTRSGASLADLDWVITVPAIWMASGKQMMREAAYLAGLLSDTPEIKRLTPTKYSMEHQLLKGKQKNAHKLTLAFEPECAALYCQQLNSDLLAPYTPYIDDMTSLSADSYMVCDLGAGTVDITAFIKHGEDDIEVVIPPTGNNSGGKEVNQQFYHLLEQIVNDVDFNSFLSSKKEKRSSYQAIINSTFFHEFEQKKRVFGMEVSDQTDDSKDLRVLLNLKFVMFYTEEKITEGIKDDRIVFDEEMNTLEIKYTKVKELFDPVVQSAIECITNALMRNEIKGRIKMIYLVGGFGGCKYTYSALRKAIPSDIRIIVPKQHTLAVSIGAVLYCRNPKIIKARVMDASYGISCTRPFDDKIHDEDYAFTDPDNGEKRCNHVFLVFVKKGQRVAINEWFKEKLIPYSQATVEATFTFFTTTDLSLQYTEDKQGRNIAEKIGSITLPCKNPKDLDKKDRNMMVEMNFGSTEIKVRAQVLYLDGQPKVEAVVDFLSV